MEKRIEKEGLGMRLGKRPVTLFNSECFTYKAFYEQGTHISWALLGHLTENTVPYSFAISNMQMGSQTDHHKCH